MSSSLMTNFQNLSRYNRIANRVIYQSCALLPAEELVRERAMQYGTLIGTLNHALVMDRIWLDRFTGTESGMVLERTSVLERDFDKLRSLRQVEDVRIQDFTDSLKISFLSSQFRYKDLSDQYRHDPADRLVMHMFTHAVHHRSQIQQCLREMGANPPNLDFHVLLRR